MSDQTSVYIDALTDFGKPLYVDDASKLAHGLGKSMDAISAAVVGVLGTDEAQTFAAWNLGMLEAFSKFVGDAVHGYRSLGAVAIIMASNYRHGDLSQAEAMADVMDEFNPTGDTPTIADADKHKPPKVKQRKLPQTTIPQDPCHRYSQPAKPDSPLAKWQQHEDRYKKWESWRPTEPDPSAQPKPTPPPRNSPTPRHSKATPSPSPQASPTPPPAPKTHHKATPPPDHSPGENWCPAD